MPEQRTEPYPHAIVYDFESWLDKTKRSQPTNDLTYENVHTLKGDTLDRQQTHICDADPKALVVKFMRELQRRAAAIRAEVEAQFMPEDIALLPKKQQQKIRDWCGQVPVLGFNSGKYDLNLIKQHFVQELADTCKKVTVAVQGSQTMFLITPEFNFLDVINYLGAGTSYDKWVKAYGCTQTKSWFSYEWFDSPDKLTYQGLPDYPAWFSRQKDLLTPNEWESCKRVFREKGMATFADWLRYYNDLDVGPFIEAAEKMKAFYAERGIDIFKDTVSLPWVSLQYILRGIPENTLYAPGEEAYKYLKPAVTGGPSIVFTRYHEAIKYRPEKCLAWFVNEVTAARRLGDVNKEKALLAEIFKLLGNSGYGKLIEALERHNVSYTKDEKTVDRSLHSAWFEDLTEIGAANEIKSRKPRVRIHRPFQVGIAVYQLAKLRILEFYYDFLDRFVDRQDFELIQMDTDSLYYALSARKLEDVVLPELKGEFAECKKDWLAWDTWSGRTPGPFKLEFEGHRAIALCSKCYFVDDDKKAKHSSKGMSARLNSLTWGRYKAALEGSIDRAENRRFRMRNRQMTTYHQEKLGLSAYYDKRRVLPDGIHTEPIEYILNAVQ